MPIIRRQTRLAIILCVAIGLGDLGCVYAVWTLGSGEIETPTETAQAAAPVERTSSAVELRRNKPPIVQANPEEPSIVGVPAAKPSLPPTGGRQSDARLHEPAPGVPSSAGKNGAANTAENNATAGVLPEERTASDRGSVVTENQPAAVKETPSSSPQLAPPAAAAKQPAPPSAMQRQPAPTPSLSASAVKELVDRGDQFLAAGDIASARLFFERAANAGDTGAAARMAETFDPAFLKSAGVHGVQGDASRADLWYRRAQQLAAMQSSPALTSPAPKKDNGVD